jgi:hypothetical protein
MRFASLLLLFLAAGCIIDGTSDGPDDDSDGMPPARTAPIVPVSRGCLQEPGLHIVTAAVVYGYAAIIAEHGGGCGEHTYKVCWDGLLGIGEPTQVALTVHDRTDDTCDALVRQPLLIDLAALRTGDDGQALELVFPPGLARAVYP